jgi:hypothetical protein
VSSPTLPSFTSSILMASVRGNPTATSRRRA